MKWRGGALLALIGCLWLCVACGAGPFDGGRLRYARWLRIETCADYDRVTVLDPWDTASVRAEYALVRRGTSPHVPNTCTVIEVPCRRVLPQSTVHAALLLRLGAADRLAGICDARFVVSPRLRRAQLTDFGSGAAPDVERMKAAGVDAWWYAPFDGERPSAVEQVGIPTVCCADYMETTPLGRAEWMRFYGRLVGRGAMADSLFDEEERAYRAMCERQTTANDSARRLRVMVDRAERGTWYVPGGRSYVARVIADAGGRYVGADNAQAGSVPMEPERMLKRCEDADLWVVKYGAPQELTYATLRQEHPLNEQFRPFREHRVWGCNTLRRAYYEETPFAPSLLLRAWQHVLHAGKNEANPASTMPGAAWADSLFTPLR